MYYQYTLTQTHPHTINQAGPVYGTCLKTLLREVLDPSNKIFPFKPPKIVVLLYQPEKIRGIQLLKTPSKMEVVTFSHSLALPVIELDHTPGGVV